MLMGEIEDFYDNFYTVTQYSGLMGQFHKKYHSQIIKHLKSNSLSDILEVGAGFGEHLSNGYRDFNSYTLLDLQMRRNDPRLQDNLRFLEPSQIEKLNFVKADASDMPFDDGSFDRVVITCVLHHFKQLDKSLVEIRRVLKSDGIIVIYLPCDPGLIYRFIRHFMSHKKQSKIMKRDLTYIKYLWSLEHTGHYPGIMACINYIFRDYKITKRKFPLPFLSWNFNLFNIIIISPRK